MKTKIALFLLFAGLCWLLFLRGPATNQEKLGQAPADNPPVATVLSDGSPIATRHEIPLSGEKIPLTFQCTLNDKPLTQTLRATLTCLSEPTGVAFVVRPKAHFVLKVNPGVWLFEFSHDAWHPFSKKLEVKVGQQTPPIKWCPEPDSYAKTS